MVAQEFRRDPQPLISYNGSINFPRLAYMLPTPRDDHERKALADIEAHGLHIINVLPEDGLPNFTYSVGFWRSHQHPEIIIVGLKAELAQWILNEIGRRIREDAEAFEPMARYEGFLEGFEVQFIDVAKKHYSEHVGWAIWLNDGTDFSLLQCVWPSTDGDFPWDEGASDTFREWQPVLRA